MHDPIILQFKGLTWRWSPRILQFKGSPWRWFPKKKYCSTSDVYSLAIIVGYWCCHLSLTSSKPPEEKKPWLLNNSNCFPVQLYDALTLQKLRSRALSSSAMTSPSSEASCSATGLSMRSWTSSTRMACATAAGFPVTRTPDSVPSILCNDGEE